MQASRGGLWARFLFVALLGASAASGAATTSYLGTFTADDDLALLDFTLGATSNVSARTFSFGGGVNANGQVVPAGGFAPILSLFVADGTQDLLQLAAGSANACINPGAGHSDPATGFCWDAFFSTVLPAGNYRLALSQDDNVPLGPTFADGFLRTGDPSFTGSAFLGDPSQRFILVTGDARTADWAVDLTLAPVAAVPAPATVALLLAGFVALGLARARPVRLAQAR